MFDTLKTKEKHFTITQTHSTVDFNGAVRDAYVRALHIFGIDYNGHCGDPRTFPRSASSLNIEFVRMRAVGSMAGQSIHYEFKAWMETTKEK